MPQPATHKLTAEDFRGLVEGSPDPLAVVTDAGVLRYGTPALGRSLGYAPGEMDGQTCLSYVHPEDESAMQRAIDGALGGEDGRPAEVRMRHRDGSWRVMEVIARGFIDHAGAAAAVLHCRDVSDRKTSESLLLYQARHNALTGLPNRGAFLERLQRTIERTRRTRDHLYGVLFVDLDRFKLVNDSLGHEIGDGLLLAVAKRLNNCVRPGDMVAHLGADEFTVLVDRIRGPVDVNAVAERIHHSLGMAIPVGGEELFTTASIGISLSVSGYERADDALRDAGTAMYRAKAGGKSRTELFDRGMHARALARLKLESDLRRAVEREEFLVHYQPIVTLGTGRILGFEGLVRWQHPERGLLAPAAFIPAAEDTGLIIPISAWVLRQACGQARRWQDRFQRDPPLSISTNFTSTQFAEGATEAVLSTLEAAGLPGRQLIMEITESVAMKDLEGVIAVMRALKTLDVDLHIDDFGTGYSSLSYLHRLPADAIKVDKSFVGRLDEDPDAATMVRTIVDLAHNLGHKVVAEGIETAAQLSQLRALGCEYGQGFLFSRPLESDEAAALLERDPRW